MDDFETFKASREKIDPTSRKMTDHQWQQAYAAYRNSRERVGEGRKKKSGGSSKRRRSSSSHSGSTTTVAQIPVANLRNEVRQNSAYSDLRMMIDLLVWIGIGVIVVTAAVKLIYYTNTSAAFVAILIAVTQVIAAVIFRMILHVIIDIPDIALHERLAKEASRKEQGSPLTGRRDLV